MNNKLTSLILIVTVIYQIMFNVYVFGSDQTLATVRLSSIASLEKFPKENKYYTIDDKVYIDGLYYRFSLKSSHGNYNILSVRDLFKTCHEICVIEEYRATDQGSQVWKGAGESLKNIGRGAVKIVKEPIESAKAFKLAGAKLLRSIGRLFKEDENKEDADKKTDRDKGGERLFVGKQARIFAAEVGLDVYTDNPYAQALIREVAKKRASGSIATSVGLFFLSPIQGVGLLSCSLTPNGYDAETEKRICDESPSELRYVLQKSYEKELGIEGDKVSSLRTLLNNVNYSPREQAYICLYMRRLGKPDGSNGVEGILDVIDILGKVKSPDAATFATNQMELLSGYQLYEKNLKKLVVTSDKVGATTNNGNLLFIIPYDVVGDTAETQNFIDEVLSVAKVQGTKGIQLWITGNVTKEFIKKSKLNGVAVKENVLLYPCFASKNTTEQEKK